MPLFKAFKGIIPTQDLLHCFPTLSLDNFSSEEIKQKAGEKDTFCEMLKPYLSGNSDHLDKNLKKVRKNFEQLLSDKKINTDTTAYYLYEQKMPNNQVFRGFLGLISVQDFRNGKIKKHESTLTHKKNKLANYLDKVKLQAEPVLLTYPSNSKIELFMNYEEKSIPIVNFKDTNHISHKIWRIDNRLKMQQLKDVLDQIDSFYIADGHHRIGSTALYSEMRAEKNEGKINPNDACNYVYSFIVSNQSIKIHDYNRVLKLEKPISEEELFEKLSRSFLIHEKGETPYYPSQKFHFSMYFNNKFYGLHIKHDLRTTHGLNSLDHHLLEELVFKPIFGIENSKISKQIEYVKGNSSIESIHKIKEIVDSKNFEIGFGIYPISFNDLIRISDEQLKMPPKSTYIEPKLMTALVMYDMK